MLSNLGEEVTLWVRASTKKPLVVRVAKSDGSNKKSYRRNFIEPGVEQRLYWMVYLLTLNINMRFMPKMQGCRR